MMQSKKYMKYTKRENKKKTIKNIKMLKEEKPIFLIRLMLWTIILKIPKEVKRKFLKKIGIIYEQGKQLLKSNALAKPEDDPKKSVRDRLEECSGLKDNYQFWSCPACTLENPTEFYQCEACQQENKVLQALMNAISRPCEKRAKKGWF